MGARPARAGPPASGGCGPAALLCAALLQLPRCVSQVRDAAREGVITASSVFTPDFSAENAVDGQNGTAWLSAVLPPNSLQVEQAEIDLRGAFALSAVELVWASSGGPTPQDLAPRNYTLGVSLDGVAFTSLAPTAGGGVFAAEFAPLALGWRGGQAADPIRYVRLQVWGTGRNSFYGVAALRVFARDAPLAVLSPTDSSWLTGGTTAEITWTPLPGIDGISLELLNSPEDTTPVILDMAADQPAGVYRWPVPPISGVTGRAGVALPSQSVVVGSNYYLRLARPQGNGGRRVTTLVGPLAIAGNMAKGGQSGATSWDSLSASTSMAFDGNPASAWSSDCEMGIGGSSGGDVGEVLQIFLSEPAWVKSLRLVWNGPQMPDSYKIWYLPLDAAERTGPGVNGLPDPMADFSMDGGYMDGWRSLVDWEKPPGVINDPDRGRSDDVPLDPWPVVVDALRLQLPYSWLASCYPLAEFEVNGVPLLTVASPIDFSVVKAGVPFTPAWVTPPGATSLASVVEGGVVTLRFDSAFDVVASGWVPSNVSGWGVCYGQPFSESSGVIVRDTPADAGELPWTVPCTPGAIQYYLTFEYTVSQNAVAEPSEFFAISREPQRPLNLEAEPVLARTARLGWLPGYNNGAAIEGYVVELRKWVTTSRTEQHTKGNFNHTHWNAELLSVSGAVSEYLLEDLAPYTNYSVRLGAINVVGAGAWSEIVNFRTEPDVPDASKSLAPALINSNDVNITWRSPYHNGDLVHSFRLDLRRTQTGDTLLQSHVVTIVKCRDPNAPNATARRICPLADQKGYMDCFGVSAPANGNMGTCPRDQWLLHGEACYLRCSPGYRAVGRQPSCSFGELDRSITCVADLSDQTAASDDDSQAAENGTAASNTSAPVEEVVTVVVDENMAAADLQLTGDSDGCPGRTVHQTPPGECPYRDCAPGEVRDCDGICLSAAACTHTGWEYTSCSDWGNRQAEGDGFCAAGVNEQSSSGYHPNFNCPYHGCEGGDCGLDPLGNGVPCGEDFDLNLLIDPDADLTASCAETPTAAYNLTFIDTIRDESYDPSALNLSTAELNDMLRRNMTANFELMGEPFVNSSGAFFDGDDGIALRELQWGRTGQITVSFWINKMSQFTSNQFEYMLSQNAIAARSTNMQFVIADQSFVRMTLVDDQTNRASLRLYDHVVKFDRWQHIAMTCGVRGLFIFVGGLPVPSQYITVLSGNMPVGSNANFGSFTMDTDLHIASRTDRHPGRFYRGVMASMLIFDAALNHLQVSCLYEYKWETLVEESCYSEVTEIDAKDAGVIGVDGSQSFCGPVVEGLELWHMFDGLVSGVGYSIDVVAINDVGGSVAVRMPFAARTALMQTVPVLIERSVTKPNLLSVESMLVNLGDGNLEWNVSAVDFVGEIAITPTSGMVLADGVGILKMDMQSPGLPPGVHRVEITLTSNAATRPGIETVIIMMSVDSHAVPLYSTAEGPSLSMLTRSKDDNQIFVFAFDEDNEVAVAGNDPFELRVDPMPAGAAQNESLPTNADANGTALVANATAVAQDWSDWSPTGEPISRGVIIGFGSGVYRAEYDSPEVPGMFLTSITLNGQHIKGSPFVSQSVCAIGEYDDETGANCIACDPTMMACTMEGTVLRSISHVDGVWRSSVQSVQFHWCDNGECKAGIGPQCNDGYTGTLCRSCAEGYGQLTTSCLACPKAEWLVVAITLAVNILPFVTIKYWIKFHTGTRELYRSQLGAIYKIGFNFLQTSSMIPAYQSAFPPILEILFGAQRAFSSFGSSTRMLHSCVLDLLPADAFFAASLLATLLPLALLVLVGLAIAFNLHYQRFDKVNDHLLKLLLLLYVAFPTIVRITGESFTCVTVDTDMPSLLKAEPAVFCNAAPESFVAVVGAVAGLAIPGIPLVLVALVWRARQTNTLEEEVTIWRFGWLHAEYEYSLWEAAVLLRKAIIALLPAMLPGATPQTLYLCATCAFFFAILAHALLLPYSVPYAVTAQCELVSLLCSFAVFACCFFREGLAATSENPAAAKETDGVAIAMVVTTAFALWFFHAMHKLVAILENDGGRSSAISWADIQTYFRYSLIPTKGAGIIRNLRYQKRVAPLRGPALYKREDAEQIDDRERRSRKGAQA